MQCDICFRTGGKKLPFLCATDARNRLYEPRIQHTHVLLEKDTLDREINDLLAKQDGDTNRGVASRQDVDTMLAESDQSIDRTQQIIAHAEELRAKVDKAREEIAKKRAALNNRKSELSSATNGVEARRTRQMEEVDKATRMGRYKWNQIHTVTASSRGFLCGEAAKLYGLRRVRKNGGLEEYKIGGIGIADLRSMNSMFSRAHFFFLRCLVKVLTGKPAASPAQISTALSHIVHLLILCTHYLAIRLPAEITLPHRDYPLPTIFSLASSYKNTGFPSSGTTPIPAPGHSPSTSRQIPAEAINLPRPRPLSIQKPLPMLATEDPVAYSLFLEGVTLLAYNIAWLCKSQGIPVGDNASFEDICNIGRNFYELLIGSQLRPVPSRTTSLQSTSTKNDANSNIAPEERKSLMGRYSHGTAHSFLGNAEGTDFTRSWKLPNPQKLSDKLKSKLMSEVANAEWEFLDQDAWAMEDEMGDDGVVVGARREEGRGGGLLGMAGMQSFMSMRTVVDAVEIVSSGGEVERKPGTSGWTKLKPR